MLFLLKFFLGDTSLLALSVVLFALSISPSSTGIDRLDDSSHAEDDDVNDYAYDYDIVENTTAELAAQERAGDFVSFVVGNEHLPPNGEGRASAHTLLVADGDVDVEDYYDEQDFDEENDEDDQPMSRFEVANMVIDGTNYDYSGYYPVATANITIRTKKLPPPTAAIISLSMLETGQVEPSSSTTTSKKTTTTTTSTVTPTTSTEPKEQEEADDKLICFPGRKLVKKDTPKSSQNVKSSHNGNNIDQGESIVLDAASERRPHGGRYVITTQSTIAELSDSFSAYNSLRCSAGSSHGIGRLATHADDCARACLANDTCVGFNVRLRDGVCISRSVGCHQIKDMAFAFFEKRTQPRQAKSAGGNYAKMAGAGDEATHIVKLQGLLTSATSITGLTPTTTTSSSSSQLGNNKFGKICVKLSPAVVAYREPVSVTLSFTDGNTCQNMTVLMKVLKQAKGAGNAKNLKNSNKNYYYRCVWGPNRSNCRLPTSPTEPMPIISMDYLGRWLKITQASPLTVSGSYKVECPMSNPPAVFYPRFNVGVRPYILTVEMAIVDQKKAKRTELLERRESTFGQNYPDVFAFYEKLTRPGALTAQPNQVKTTRLALGDVVELTIMGGRGLDPNNFNPMTQSAEGENFSLDMMESNVFLLQKILEPVNSDQPTANASANSEEFPFPGYPKAIRKTYRLSAANLVKFGACELSVSASAKMLLMPPISLLTPSITSTTWEDRALVSLGFQIGPIVDEVKLEIGQMPQSYYHSLGAAHADVGCSCVFTCHTTSCHSQSGNNNNNKNNANLLKTDTAIRHLHYEWSFHDSSVLPAYVVGSKVLDEHSDSSGLFIVDAPTCRQMAAQAIEIRKRNPNGDLVVSCRSFADSDYDRRAPSSEKNSTFRQLVMDAANVDGIKRQCFDAFWPLVSNSEKNPVPPVPENLSTSSSTAASTSTLSSTSTVTTSLTTTTSVATTVTVPTPTTTTAKLTTPTSTLPSTSTATTETTTTTTTTMATTTTTMAATSTPISSTMSGLTVPMQNTTVPAILSSLLQHLNKQHIVHQHKNAVTMSTSTTTEPNEHGPVLRASFQVEPPWLEYYSRLATVTLNFYSMTTPPTPCHNASLYLTAVVGGGGGKSGLNDVSDNTLSYCVYGPACMQHASRADASALSTMFSRSATVDKHGRWIQFRNLSYLANGHYVISCPVVDMTLHAKLEIGVKPKILAVQVETLPLTDEEETEASSNDVFVSTPLNYEETTPDQSHLFARPLPFVPRILTIVRTFTSKRAIPLPVASRRRRILRNFQLLVTVGKGFDPQSALTLSFDRNKTSESMSPEFTIRGNNFDGSHNELIDSAPVVESSIISFNYPEIVRYQYRFNGTGVARLGICRILAIGMAKVKPANKVDEARFDFNLTYDPIVTHISGSVSASPASCASGGGPNFVTSPVTIIDNSDKNNKVSSQDKSSYCCVTLTCHVAVCPRPSRLQYEWTFFNSDFDEGSAEELGGDERERGTVVTFRGNVANRPDQLAFNTTICPPNHDDTTQGDHLPLQTVIKNFKVACRVVLPPATTTSTTTSTTTTPTPTMVDQEPNDGEMRFGNGDYSNSDVLEASLVKILENAARSVQP